MPALAPPPPYFAAPAGRRTAIVRPGGTTILPNGRFLTPVGERLWTGEDLWNVLVSPDGKTIVGFHDGGLTVFRDGGRREIKVKELAPAGAFFGNGRLWVSRGDDATLAEVDLTEGKILREIALGEDAYANDLAIAPDGRRAYAVDVARQDVLTLDLAEAKVLARTKAGREPYALALSPDGRRLFVANIGVFDYSLVPGGPLGITRPAFGFPSKEARRGTRFEGREIAGLGDPRVPDASSVWAYDVSGAAPRVFARAKTGLLIHAPADGGKAVGGSAPNALATDGRRLYVANANNDTVDVLDAATLRRVRSVKIAPVPALARYRGVIPSGLALSRDGSRLYVGEAGLNAVGVIETATGRVLGHVPSGWFPTAVRLSPDGRRLYAATQKGLGRGPKGALDPRPAGDERFGLAEMPGMVQAFDLPADADLARLTRTVLDNAGLVSRPRPRVARVFPLVPGTPSEKIKHVVFITKENHTFDGIFGTLEGSDGRPEYAQYGERGWIAEKGKAERLPIMPNHLALARRFAISDNFYMEPQASGDGHRWLVGVYPSLWTTRLFYAGWDFRRKDSAKGRLVSFGSNGSQIPEDYLENGSLWEHLERGGVTFRNYGEGFEFPGVEESGPRSRSGAEEPVNFPMPLALYKNTCFEFPIFNTTIPDIARADWFVEDLEKNYRKKGRAIPRFLNIAICNDHGDTPRPKFGYPYVSSYMADNDLALGRIVEYLTHLPEWRSMAIFVTQDDSGGDDDHVDRHRSFVLGISPWIKRGYVSKEHTSIMSILRTIYGLFGLGPNHLFDAAATPLGDFFTDEPDFRPYTHVGVDPRVFVPSATLDPNDPKFEKRRGNGGSVKMDSPEFFEWLRKRGG